MATGFLHHIGTFLLFSAAILLLVCTISAPVVPDISFAKVTLVNMSDIRHSSVTFGTFGHCVLDVAPASTDQDYCPPATLGYSPLAAMAAIDGSSYSNSTASTTSGLTTAFVLHPIACALALLACLLAFGSGVCGDLAAAPVAALAWLLALVVMAVDLAAFGTLKNQVNADGSSSVARWGPAIWACVAAVVCLFVGMFWVLATCLSRRRQEKRRRSAAAAGRRTSKSAAKTGRTEFRSEKRQTTTGRRSWWRK